MQANRCYGKGEINFCLNLRIGNWDFLTRVYTWYESKQFDRVHRWDRWREGEGGVITESGGETGLRGYPVKM